METALNRSQLADERYSWQFDFSLWHHIALLREFGHVLLTATLCR
jgi:hypothetical protein